MSLPDDFQNLENRLLRHGVRRPPDETSALLAADFFEIGQSGVVWDRQQAIEGLARESPVDRSTRAFSARALSENIVTVTYRSVSLDPIGGQERRALRSSIWPRFNLEAD